MIFLENVLLYSSFIPLIGIIVITLTKNTETRKLKTFALHFSFAPLLLYIVLWGSFKKTLGVFQFVTTACWIPVLNLNVTLGVDGISLFFILLSIFLIPLCILASWNTVKDNLKIYLNAFLLIEFLLINVFCVLDVFLFYIFLKAF